MNRVSMALLLAAVLFVPATTAHARFPSYLILRGPVAAEPHHSSRGYYPGYGYAVEPQAYSYGWFGAHPHPQWSRQFGYYRNYTQWSAR